MKRRYPDNHDVGLTRPPVVDGTLIGQAMLAKGLLTEEQLAQVLAAQPKQQQRLGEVAISLGLITERDFARFLADFFRLPYLELDDSEDLDLSAVDRIPEAMARRYHVIVTQQEGDLVTVVMADPLDVRATDAVRLETNCRVRKAVSSPSAILRTIHRAYHASSRIAKSMDQLVAGDTAQDEAQQDERLSEANGEKEQLRHEASDAPVVQFVNLLLMRAIQERASDVHLEPEEHSVTIRLRVDGQLREVTAPPKSMLQAITTVTRSPSCCVTITW